MDCDCVHLPQLPHHGQMLLCKLVQRHQIVAQKWDLTSKINKGLSKETQLHVLTFQSWYTWGCLGGCHSPLPNGQLLNVGFFPWEGQGQCKDKLKKAQTIFQTKGVTRSQNHRMAEIPQRGHLVQDPKIPAHPWQHGTRFYSDCSYISPVSWWCCSQDHFRNTFATIPPEHQSAGTAQNMHFLCNKVYWDPLKCKNYNSQPKILSVRIFFDSFTPSNGHKSTNSN